MYDFNTFDIEKGTLNMILLRTNLQSSLYPDWSLSEVATVLVGIVRGGNCPGGSCPE